MYVFSESIFPLLTLILSLETCLKSLYSRNMFQGSTYTPQIGNTDCEFVIQVMDQQKYAAAAMVLAKALVDQEKQIANKATEYSDQGQLLPQIPLHKAREIMTRADFIRSYDHINIFTIDAQAMVRADSVPMQNAFRQICGDPGFEEHLQATLDRISAIESLGRTREVVAKDLIAGNYKMSGRLDRGEGVTVKVLPAGDS